MIAELKTNFMRNCGATQFKNFSHIHVRFYSAHIVSPVHPKNSVCHVVEGLT